MPQPSPAELGLTAYLKRLKRPVEFACRADGAKLDVIRNLGAFLSQSARDGLATPQLLPIHSHLRQLDELLDGYDDLPVENRRARLFLVRSLLEGASGQSDARTDVRAEDKHRAGSGAAASADGLDVSAPIRSLPGVGSRKAELLHRLGIERIGDLLWMLPWRYVDRGHPVPLGAVRAGDDATVCGELRSIEVVVTARRRMRIVQAVLADATGALTLKWFNQSYLENQLVSGQTLMCSGRVRQEGLLDSRVMENPQFEIVAPADAASLHTGRIVSIYHETRGLNSRALRVLMDRALCAARGIEDDCLPDDVRKRCRLVPRGDAFRAVHFPPPKVNLADYNAGTSRAHRRLVFEECFLLELGLAARRHETSQETGGVRFRCEPRRLHAFWASLPFQPTAAQRNVVGEVLTDMAASRPMNRLLQGDVGCGKTLVAAAAIWMAAGDGYQAAMMAPTELLAEQHHRELTKLLGALGGRVASVTGDLPRRARTALLRRLAAGEIDCVVGTHALVQPDVRFARFGLAVIDEQHKFGVLQRSHLVGKGYHPDVLIMTATPIPRTLALSVYGDLDVSVIDEMPAGRHLVETLWYGERQRSLANELIRRELRAGHQAFVVAPRVDESPEVDVRSAVELARRLQQEVFPEACVGLLHGRLSRVEKDKVMGEFLRGAIHVLAATTVVEVGLDVPNATVMMIEHADRYGLAQLHQLRGRVGRGRHRSMCVLMAGGWLSREARERLETMVAVQDGFILAERDLALRGPGEFLGTRQSGLPDLKVANLVRDARVLELARAEAFEVFRQDPALTDPRHRSLKSALLRTWGRRLSLGTIG
ncbi:MAG: ATP-dependent DNA helicase RecG [Nitrospirae bacterium]|nr:ATP-dependent DNA helicase RecG [Nitrospirota bacterium]